MIEEIKIKEIKQLLEDYIILSGICTDNIKLERNKIDTEIRCICNEYIGIESIDKKDLEEIKKSKNIYSLKNTIITLARERLSSKKIFHIYIEENYSNANIEDYITIYKEYKEYIEQLIEELSIMIDKEIEDTKRHLLNKKEILDNAEDYVMSIFNEKYELATLLQNSLNEVKKYATLFKNYDYSNLNIIEDKLMIIWVQSIRDKNKMDRITKAFMKFTAHDKNNKLYIEQNKNGEYFFKSFPIEIFMLLSDENRIKNKSSFILALYRIFKDVDFVKALCTTRHKEQSIMDLKTFNTHLENIALR